MSDAPIRPTLQVEVLATLPGGGAHVCGDRAPGCALKLGSFRQAHLGPT